MAMVGVVVVAVSYSRSCEGSGRWCNFSCEHARTRRDLIFLSLSSGSRLGGGGVMACDALVVNDLDSTYSRVRISLQVICPLKNRTLL